MSRKFKEGEFFIYKKYGDYLVGKVLKVEKINDGSNILRVEYLCLKCNDCFDDKDGVESYFYTRSPFSKGSKVITKEQAFLEIL